MKPTNQISTSPAVIYKAMIINYQIIRILSISRKKFNISPISEKLPGIQYMINLCRLNLTFDRETG